MLTQQQVPEIVEEVRQRLADLEQQGVYLQVVDGKLEDDWLYVMVTPSRDGVRASEHARYMSQIERELRKKGTDHVLLVPTLED